MAVLAVRPGSCFVVRLVSIPTQHLFQLRQFFAERLGLLRKADEQKQTDADVLLSQGRWLPQVAQFPIQPQLLPALLVLVVRLDAVGRAVPPYLDFGGAGDTHLSIRPVGKFEAELASTDICPARTAPERLQARLQAQVPLLIKPRERLVFCPELLAGVKAERQGFHIEGVERVQDVVGKQVFRRAHDGEILPHDADKH